MRTGRVQQRGAAALAVTLLLLFVMTLVAGHANHQHLFAQRASANHYRATQAFEAAEAGIEWTVAMLNQPQAVNDRCEADTMASRTFRERHLADAAVRSACTWDGDRWQCACPDGGDPAPPVLPSAGPAPGFDVAFAAASRGGLVRLVATGCSGAAGCTGASADATARIQITLGRVGHLATLPIAPLTVRETVDAGPAAIGLHNADALSGGATVHAGGLVLTPQARLTGAPGAPRGTSSIEGDMRLRASDGDHLFTSLFGLPKGLWREQPSVRRVACDGGCADVLSNATKGLAAPPMIWVDGPLELDGAVTIGSREQPVIVVASGEARLAGPVTIHGLVYAAGWRWRGAGGRVVGAAVSERGYAGDGTPDFIYDRPVLGALQRRAGSFARLPGSWSDF